MVTSIEERQALYKRLNINFAVVSALVERQREGETELLIQTRWKPETDPVYSGLIEIPAGGLDYYENVYDAVAREVREETGLQVVRFIPDIRTKVYAPRGDDCFAFLPFCCQQQLRGGWPRVGFVFRCEVVDDEPVPRPEETREIRWVKKVELREIVENTPERIFTMQLPVLDYYLNH